MSDSDRPSVQLLRDFSGGSESAAAEMFDRYVARLTRLARARMSAKLLRRVDPEDVVLSAYRSFFVAARNRRFELEHSGDLWRLLARMTLHKLYRQAARHSADKRAVANECALTDEATVAVVRYDPAPDEAVALADELEALMQRLDALSRRVLELRLQGHTHAEIAAVVDRTERTVRRVLAEIRRAIADDGGFALVPEDATGESREDETPSRRLPQIVEEFFGRRGERDFHDYLLQQHLGSGATGKVYRALEKTTGRTVAAKFLRKDLLANEAVVQRFVEEADVIAALHHPGIVRTRGFGRTPNGGFFLVQEYVDGPNLQSRSPAPVADAVRWIAGAADALQHAHDRGVIHCDLKPGNLLLGSDGHVRVTDFGLAQRTDAAQRNVAGIAGTLGFMAPEQVDPLCGTIGPQTDVYGLGATLFALLTGGSPVTGERIADALANVVAGPPIPALDALRADVSSAVSAAVGRCLERDPDRRFSTAAELSAALRS